MRRGFLVAGLVALVVAAIGLFRPSHPPERAVTASPAPATPRHTPSTPADEPLFDEPESEPAADAAIGTRLQTVRLLRRRDFDALHALLVSRQERVEQDARNEAELDRVLEAFAVADAGMDDALDAWVTRDPAAWSARLARATHHLAVAHERRGAKAARDTSPEEFAGMRAALARAAEDATAALERRKTLVHAYAVLVSVAQLVAGPEECLRVAGAGLAVSPASFRIRLAAAHCMLPRWGGSYDLLDRVVTEAQTHVAQNPRLAALRGYIDWDRGSVAALDRRDDEAIRFYDRALAAGELAMYYEWRARAYQRQKRYTDALADVARALAVTPDSPDLLVRRADVLAELKRYPDALADVRLVEELDPTNARLAAFREHEAATAVAKGFDLLERSNDWRRGVALYDWAVALQPTNAEARYWRGRAYLKRNDEAQALADFEEAVRLDPRHFEAYRNLDWLLAKRGRWPEVIRRWDAYIALEPMNGLAYFERAGARKHSGDMPGALADARKACELGTREACDVVRGARR